MDTSELYKDLSKGLRVLGQVLQSRWCKWTKGPSLFFWRWNGREQIRAARDGMRIFVQGTLPQGRSNCPKFKEADIPLVATKIEGMLRKGYLSSGFVVNLLHYFAVPKGDADIRVVFNGTSCGLNDALWSPNFYLPAAPTVGNLSTLSTWMADIDFGDMFHNFLMDERLLKYSGVDVAPSVSFLQEGNYSLLRVVTTGEKTPSLPCGAAFFLATLGAIDLDGFTESIMDTFGCSIISSMK